MKKRISCLLFTAVSTILLTLVSAGSGTAHILRIADGTYVTFGEMIEDLKGVQLVFIGEIHDNPAHHQAQLDVIRGLHDAGVPLAIGLEMFRANSQEALDEWVSGKIGEKDFLKIYYQNWSIWPLYKNIFLYARKIGVPMIGLNIPREITAQVASHGFSSLSPQQLGELPEVTCNVDPSYMDFIKRSLTNHFHNHDTFVHFCEAQLLWDNVMAHNLVDFLTANPGYTVVVLAGAGHSWKYGIPDRIRQQSDLTYRILLPEIPGRIEPGNVTRAEADYLMIGLEEGPLH